MALAMCLALPAQAAGPQSPLGHLERVMADKEVRVCIWPDYYGISYRNPKTQVL
jgi:hypothetical protein